MERERLKGNLLGWATQGAWPPAAGPACGEPGWPA